MKVPFLISLLLLGLATPAAAEEKPLYLNLLWTYHSPPALMSRGVYQDSWARLRAVRDCAGMLDRLEKNPVEVTLSLSPTLIEQIRRLARGATDRTFQLAEIPADRLREKEKQELVRHAFEVPNLRRFPGLFQLKGRSSRAYSTQNWRDLQTLFFLAWLPPLDPDDPCFELSHKTRGFSEEEKMMVLSRHRQILAGLLPRLKHLQATGKIEVAMTPYGHPILPLLLNSEAGFSWASDAREQIDEGIKLYTGAFGCGPRGLWPPEGAVNQAVAPIVKGVGLRWMATGEAVLHASEQSDEGHPYQLKGGPAIFFRNDRLSEAVRTRYPHMKGEEAAKDLLGQLETLARKQDSPEILTLVVDGTRTFDGYPDGGEAFLNALYHGLRESNRLKTILPSTFLSHHAIPTLDHLASGSLRGMGLGGWHRQPAQERAWRFLNQARARVEEWRKAHPGDPRGARALRSLYLAEGSDWFAPVSWEWDRTFRGFLQESFRQLGQPIPEEWTLPVLPSLAIPARLPHGGFTPRLDGNLNEWHGGRIGGGDNLSRLDWDWDQHNLYLGLSFRETVPPFFKLQFGLLDEVGGKKFSALPFLCHYQAEISLGGGSLVPTQGGRSTDLKVAASKRVMEVRIPWAALGMKPGDEALMVVVPSGATPFPNKPILLRP